MKKQIFLIVAILILSTANAIYAQTNTIKADIPFAFSVQNKTLSAGKYVIKDIDTSGQKVFWSVSGEKKQVVLLAMSKDGADRTGKAKLIFNRYGSRYFLSSFQTPIAQVTLPKSRAERDLQRESEDRLAKTAPEMVVIEVTVE